MNRNKREKERNQNRKIGEIGIDPHRIFGFCFLFTLKALPFEGCKAWAKYYFTFSVFIAAT